MKSILFALALAGVAASNANAADKPVFAPAPAWVKPVDLPPAQANQDEAPVRILLSNQQILIEKERQVRYSETALKIQTPQGLATGNLSFAWRPETDVLTVHKLVIRRGDKVIDVIAGGQTFTVIRRETNLESAMLDGMLTANIQPEGLEVGDIMEFAISVASSDPVLKGHAEEIAGTWDGIPLERAHLRVQWPTAFPIRIRQMGALPPIKPVKSGNMTSVTVLLDNLQPVVTPKGAPDRYRIGRMIELTDFASWADVATLLAPLYQNAAILPVEGPLAAEVARIRALSADPKIRAEAALRLVQERVRYVALAMGTGGLVPTDVATTWARRYGDCKAKTVLLLAILHAMGIEAEPVAVNIFGGDGIDARLPMVGAFNHVLVRAKVAGQSYWLDGTRTGDRKLERLMVPPFGWGLPIVTSGSALVRMMPAPLDKPTQVRTIHIDATAGITIPAPTKVELVLSGDDALAANRDWVNLTGDARDRALREYWKGEYDFIDVEKTSTAFDAETGEQRFVMEGKARMDWNSGRYETDGMGIGYKADFTRPPGPDRDAPFAVSFPYYTRVVETILLPPGFAKLKAGVSANVDQTVAGIAYRRHATIEGNVFTVEKTERSMAPEFPFSEAAAAEAALRDLADKSVYLAKPTTYRPTQQELSEASAAKPTTAAGFVDRGYAQADQGHLDDAIADFDRAIALDPKNALAFANRASVRVQQGEDAAAVKDLDAAAALDARNPVVFRIRGLIAQHKGAFLEAIDFYTTALEIEPGSGFALGHRAEAYNFIGNKDKALEDAAAGIEFLPTWIELYLLRTNLLRSQGKGDEALAQAAAVVAANPDSSYAHVTAAVIYSVFDRDVEAAHAFDRAIAIKPEAYIYVNRAQHRPKDDIAGRRADIDAALKLEPDMAAARTEKAKLQEESGDISGAIATLSAAIAASPDDVDALSHRGLVHARARQSALAEADFAAARAKATDGSSLNSICWSKAIAGTALEAALQDCEAALKMQPDTPAFLDSRAFVLLRLGRFDEAIMDYDRALAKRPTMPSSLFGRAIARARKGEKAKADADAAAALKIDVNVQKDFEGFGVKLETVPPAI